MAKLCAGLLLLLAGAAPASAQALKAYGTVTDHFGTPVPGATVSVVSVDESPGVPEAERLPVGTGQCRGARPMAGEAVAGADGRFRLVLDLGAPPRAVTCLAIEATPPPGRPLATIYLALDSVPAAALAAARDSVRMDIMVPDAAAGIDDASPPPTPPTFRSADEELLWLARAVPGGFGGYWRVSGGEPMKVYLTDLSQASQAKKVLLRYFAVRPPAGGTPPDVLFMRGRQDVATLIAWRDRLRRAGAAAGVREATLRLDWNRVQVKVGGAGARARLRARLRAMSIPEQSLFIVGG